MEEYEEWRRDVELVHVRNKYFFHPVRVWSSTHLEHGTKLYVPPDVADV